MRKAVEQAKSAAAGRRDGRADRPQIAGFAVGGIELEHTVDDRRAILGGRDIGRCGRSRDQSLRATSRDDKDRTGADRGRGGAAHLQQSLAGKHIMNDDNIHRLEQEARPEPHLADGKAVELDVQGGEKTIERTQFQD